MTDAERIMAYVQLRAEHERLRMVLDSYAQTMQTALRVLDYSLLGVVFVGSTPDPRSQGGGEIRPEQWPSAQAIIEAQTKLGRTKEELEHRWHEIPVSAQAALVPPPREAKRLVRAS